MIHWSDKNTITRLEVWYMINAYLNMFESTQYNVFIEIRWLSISRILGISIVRINEYSIIMLHSIWTERSR